MTRRGRLLAGAVVLQAALAGYLAFTQPGLCPCWLLAEPLRFHPHPFAHPELPHRHDYLVDLFTTSPSQPAPAVLSAGDFLDGLRARGGLWQTALAPRPDFSSWSPPPWPPPPRLASFA